MRKEERGQIVLAPLDEPVRAAERLRGLPLEVHHEVAQLPVGERAQEPKTGQAGGGAARQHIRFHVHVRNAPRQRSRCNCELLGLVCALAEVRVHGVDAAEAESVEGRGTVGLSCYGRGGDGHGEDGLLGRPRGRVLDRECETTGVGLAGEQVYWDGEGEVA